MENCTTVHQDDISDAHTGSLIIGNFLHHRQFLLDKIIGLYINKRVIRGVKSCGVRYSPGT